MEPTGRKNIEVRNVDFVEAGEPETKIDRVVSSDVFFAPKKDDGKDASDTEGTNSDDDRRVRQFL